MKDHEFRTRCWNCGRQNDRVTLPKGEGLPDNGDISICFSCGHLAIFDSAMPDGLRKPTPAEMHQLRQDKEINKMLFAWHVVQQAER